MLVVPSILDAVTVHAEGALCTRVASVPAEGGHLPTQVRINGLPLALRTGSLRARVVQGPSGLVVRDIRPAFDVQLPPEADLPTEQRALEAAETALAEVNARLERLAQDLDATTALQPAFLPRRKGEPPRETPLGAMLALAGFVDTELAALHARRLDLERQQRDAVNEVELRKHRIRELSTSTRGQRAQVFRAALLTLSGPLPSDGDARLSLEYAVPGARWVPTYDMRLPRTLEEGTLRMRAAILQRTGEDWSGVRLSVSTADLERRAEVPELKALRIGRRQPPPARSGWREPPPGLDELFAGYDAARVPAPQPPPPPPPLAEPRPQEFGTLGGGGPRKGGPPPPMDGAPPGAPARPVPPRPAAAPAAPPPPKAAAPRMVTGSMPSVAMPAPSMPPPPARSRGGGGDLLRAEKSKKRSAPMAKEMEAYDEEEAFADEAPSADYDEGGEALEQDIAPKGLEPAEALLDYDRLELSSADQPSARGRLRPRPAHVTRELLALTAVHVRIDMVSLLAIREQQVDTVRHAPPPPWAVPPRESAAHFDARFDVEARSDVPSDGAWHTVPVLSVPVGLTAEYVCVPSVETRAFRTVRVENKTPYPLLAGPVDVTLGDEFLMTSPLPTMAPGATQRLGLGVEESIKVARNTRFDEATGGMFGGSTVLTHHVSVELANRLTNRVLVEVHERVPAVPASEKDIKVDEAEVAPTWQKRALLPGEVPVEGERAWRVVLQPGEAQTLRATWTVKIPASKMLGGGNRRT